MTMKRLILLAFILHQWLDSANAKDIIQYFLELKTYDHFVICDSAFDDETLERFKDHTRDYKVYLEKWDCSQKVGKTNKALIFMNNPEPHLITNLLNQSGAQKSLTSNTWLIQSKENEINELDYFKKNKLRIGLNAKIFIAKVLGTDIFLYQALGDGTTTPQYKVKLSFIGHRERTVFSIKISILIYSKLTKF